MVVCVLFLAGGTLQAFWNGPDRLRGDAGLLLGSFWRTYQDRRHADVSDDDLEVMRWIERNLPEDAVIVNNVADGGHLIPAVSHRKIATPHYHHIWYRQEFGRWISAHPAGYVFVGARPIATEPIRYRAEDAERSGAVLLYRRGDARIYRRVIPLFSKDSPR